MYDIKIYLFFFLSFNSEKWLTMQKEHKIANEKISALITLEKNKNTKALVH